MKLVIAPGLLVQAITTKRPDTSQIEVAIAAFEAMRGNEADVAVAEGIGARPSHVQRWRHLANIHSRALERYPEMCDASGAHQHGMNTADDVGRLVGGDSSSIPQSLSCFVPQHDMTPEATWSAGTLSS